MLQDLLYVGSNEILNQLRVTTYMRGLGSPLSLAAGEGCVCETLTPAMLDDNPYVSPTADPAPWYDPDTPNSGDFLGLFLLNIDGVDGSTRQRAVTNAVGGGGVFGKSQDLPRTITVTGVLVGRTCCAADYGLHWLQEALAGCSGDPCGGDCVQMYDCCPPATLTHEQFNDQHRRTFVRTALVSGPTVTGRQGGSRCGGTCGGGDLIEVEFVLVAGSPVPWTEPTPVLDVDIPIGGTGDCFEWCTTGCTDCLYRDCTEAGSDCADPRVTVPTPPKPTLPTAGFCIPLGPETVCYALDLSARPGWSSDVPIVRISSGSQELRNVRVVFYERPVSLPAATCAEVAQNQRCNPINEFYVTYMPANSATTFDGRTGFTLTDCAGTCENSAYAYGNQDGGPVVFNDLTCAKYCVCIESDPLNPPAADAGVSVSLSGRGL